MRIRYLIFFGIVLIITGFIYDVIFAGIPYQDPPPELIAKYNLNKTISEVITDSGFMLIILGIIGAIVKKIKRT